MCTRFSNAIDPGLARLHGDGAERVQLMSCYAIPAERADSDGVSVIMQLLSVRQLFYCCCCWRGALGPRSLQVVLHRVIWFVAASEVAYPQPVSLLCFPEQP